MVRLRKMMQWVVEKKRYVEFFTASLSMPLMITALILNLNNINGRNKVETKQEVKGVTSNNNPDKISVTVINPDVTQKQTPSPTPTPASVVNVTPTPDPGCKKEVGPVEILNPVESKVLTSNPVAIDISYDSKNYCGVVWSYRINGSNWSDYTSKNIYIYDMSRGEKKLDVKVKSTASSDETTLTRNFVYGSTDPTTTPTPSPSPTPTLTPGALSIQLESTASSSAVLQ